VDHSAPKLFYVVKTSSGYEMTPAEMRNRMAADRKLERSLDRSPFTTREEADKRIAELNAL
jgi:hypothetical protein